MQIQWLAREWKRRQAQKQEAEERALLIAKAEAFEQMVQSLGWKYFLDFLEEEDNASLLELNKANRDDPWACQAALIKRDVSLGLLNRAQQHVLGTIDSKNKLLQAENEEKEHARGFEN